MVQREEQQDAIRDVDIKPSMTRGEPHPKKAEMLRLLAEGYSLGKIAKEMGLHSRTVSKVLCPPTGEEIHDLMRKYRSWKDMSEATGWSVGTISAIRGQSCYKGKDKYEHWKPEMLRVIKECKGSVSEMARCLDISRTRCYDLIKQCGFTAKQQIEYLHGAGKKHLLSRLKVRLETSTVWKDSPKDGLAFVRHVQDAIGEFERRAA